MVTASFVRPEPVPIERLLNSAEAYVIANPDSAEGHYILGRIHYLAFARSSVKVPAITRNGNLEQDNEGKPRVAADWQIMPGMSHATDRRAFELALKEVGLSKLPQWRTEPEKFRVYKAAYDRHLLDQLHAEYRRQLQDRWTKSSTMPDEKAIAHATAALNEFRLAIQLPREYKTLEPLSAPTHGLYELGLASLTEQFAEWKKLRKPTLIPDELKEIDHQKARDAYLNAFRIAYPFDSKLTRRPLNGFQGIVSYEAGTAFLRLAKTDPRHQNPNTELAEAMAEVKAGVDKLGQLERGAITPIVFSMQSHQSIFELVSMDASVDFDLRGFGPKTRWPWVKPTTALLVWDPERTGRIVSGRQLFGSYTFEIFWRDGYAALAALDDNHDGWLRGSELDGLRAWFDSDENGRSESSEVRDVDELGVVGIAVHAVTHEGVHPKNPHGMQLEDGRTLPTWDWVVEPVNSRNTIMNSLSESVRNPAGVAQHGL